MTTLEAASSSGRAELPAGRARRRPPRSLVVLVVVAVVEALAWICVMPPLQGPDEVGHFAYTQKIVEAGEVPWDQLGWAPERGTRAVSTEVERALEVAAILPSWGNPSARPAATALEERIWEREQDALTSAQRADGGFTSSMLNPPAYYLVQAVPYAATSWGSVFDRALVMRLANLPLLVVMVVFCWLIAGELLGGVRWLQTLATAAVVLQPQVIHLAATVNPDIALGAIWSAALYLMIRMLKTGPTRSRVAWIAALVVLSSLTQPRGLALLIPAVAAVALAWWRHRSAGAARRRVPIGLAALYAAGAVVFFAYAMAGDPSAARARQFGSYLWQFYLPPLPFMQASISPGWEVRQAFVDRLFGGFAQLEVAPPPGVLDVVAVAAGVLLLLAGIGVVVRRRALARRPEIAVVCGLAIVGYLALIHVVAFRDLLANPDPIVTGRYLLPLIAFYGVAIALAVSWLPRRLAVSLAVVVLVGLSFLQVECLALLYERFYA